MKNETARQAYIRLLRERADFPDSLTSEQRDLVLNSELIYGEYLDGVVNPNSSGMFPSSVIVGLPKSKGRLFLQQLEKEELDASIVQKHRESFKSLDRRELSAMDDKALAAWQSDFKQDEPEWRIAEHEWQRRITATQIRAGRWAIAFALFGVIVGAFLHWSLSSWHPFDKQRRSPDVQAQTKTNSTTQQPQPAATPMQSRPQPFQVAPMSPIQTNPPPKP
jgi:hypothetical protein